MARAKRHYIPGYVWHILVEFAPEKHTFDNFMDVAFLLEEILGRKVELITPEALSPHIGPHILKEVAHCHVMHTDCKLKN